MSTAVFLCLLKTTEAGLGRKRQGQRRPGAGGEGVSRHHHQGAVAARREASELPRTQVQPSHEESEAPTCSAASPSARRANTPLIGRFAQSGKYSYYVCQSTIKLGRDACKTPTLNARRFEELVVARIRSNILTEGNIRDLVKVVVEEMDGVTREQRKRLETIEDELEEVKRKLGRIWHFIETSDAVMTDASDRIREHRERQERLEYFAEQARAVLAQRRKVLDDVNTIAAYAKDMKDFLKESELTERRAFIQSFIKEIVVVPGDALLRYTVPMPDDSLIPGRAAEKVALNGSVLSTLPDGGPIGP